MHKPCFGEYCAFNDNCDRCHELDRYCKIWKNNIFNFKRKRNLLMFISFILLVAWNFKVGFDFLKADLNLFAVLNFLVVLLFFITLGSSIKSRKKAMEAYQVYLRNTGKIQRRAITQTETKL